MSEALTKIDGRPIDGNRYLAALERRMELAGQTGSRIKQRSSKEQADSWRGIRDGRLYREKYASFEDYCLYEWGMSLGEVNGIIARGDQPEFVPQPRPSVPPRARLSCVYFIEAVGAACIKIGVSFNAAQRVSELQTACPFDLRLIATIPGATERDEQALHERFAAHRVRGEWFVPSPEIMAFIAERAVPHAQ